MPHLQQGRAWLAWIFSLLALGLLGAVGLPATAYVLGKRFGGTYEGKYGIMDYLGSIYGAALAGEAPAWLVLLAPALIAGVWYGVYRAWPRSRHPA